MSHSNIPLDELDPSPIRHAELSPDLVARVKDIQTALNEVYPSSLEDWLDDFRRDLHPEHEVVWWERLAECYLVYRNNHALDANLRQAAFKILLSITMGAFPDTISADTATLPKGAFEDIRVLLREHGL